MKLAQYQVVAARIEEAAIPGSYRCSVYIHRGPNLRCPWYPDQIVDAKRPEVFTVGQGAAGEAFEQGAMALAVGDAVSSAEFRLSAIQQAYYANDQVVVAVPIRKLDDSIIGVLSVISTSNDGTYVSADGAVQLVGMDALDTAAEGIGNALRTDHAPMIHSRRS